MTLGAPSAKSRRQPVSTRWPISRPLVQARTTPARVLRSAIPTAASPSALAAITSSPGCEAPRRKLKLLVAWSSA